MKIRESVSITITEKKIPAIFHTFKEFDHRNEHLLIEIRNKKNAIPDTPLIRIHSECLTGDVFGSGRCDCGNQLREAIHRISETGGFIAYLRQEGRGIGLYNKLDAYKLQDIGLDTYAANRKLGFQEDERQFDMVAQMLKVLGVSRILLLSNNPDKVKALQDNGIDVVQRMSTQKYVSEFNEHYLQAKHEKHNHIFGEKVTL